MEKIGELIDIGELREWDTIVFGDGGDGERVDFIDEEDDIDGKPTFSVYVKAYSESTQHFKNGKSVEDGILDIEIVKLKDRSKDDKTKCLWCNGTGKK